MSICVRPQRCEGVLRLKRWRFCGIFVYGIETFPFIPKMEERSFQMGKDLRGRNIGKGISQRKDGWYQARFINKNGKRVSKLFEDVSQAKKWITLSRLEDEDNSGTAPEYRMTVDEWFSYWMKIFKQDLSPNTKRNYRERYFTNVKPYIGDMLLADVKAMHCQQILNEMQVSYATSTVYQTYICMGPMFKCALQNDLISKHPLDAVVFKGAKMKKPIRCLTIEEQRLFLEQADKNANAKQFRLLLQTGLRTGELIGLTWDNFDRVNRILTVDKALEYRHERGYWRAAPPKTVAGYRKNPLTEEAYNILMSLYEKKDTRKEAPALDQVLTFTDAITGLQREVRMKDLIFVNFRTGEPTKNSTYDTNLYKICDKAGIRPFYMHGPTPHICDQMHRKRSES